MFIQTKNELLQLPRPALIRVAECKAVAWRYQGVDVSLREFIEAKETHALISYERGYSPHPLAFGSRENIEAAFAALAKAIAQDARVFDLDQAMANQKMHAAREVIE